MYTGLLKRILVLSLLTPCNFANIFRCKFGGKKCISTHCFRKHRTGNLAVAFQEEQWVLLKADVTKAYRRIQVLPEEWKYQVARLGDKWWINMVGSISTQIRFQSSGHFRPALLGSSWSVQRSWFAGRVGTFGELLRCEIPGCGQGSAQGDGENYQVRDILNPMSQHQQKSPERPNPSIRMMFSSVAKNLDLGSGLNFCFCDDVLFDLAPMEWPARKI